MPASCASTRIKTISSKCSSRRDDGRCRLRRRRPRRPVPSALAVAAALGREGLGVALLERGALGAYDGPRGDDDWDQRVYALSPGSANFLRGLGAWQRLPPERLAAVEMMDVHGDAGGAIAFSAYELGERALAWIVENRELCATLVEAVRTFPAVAVLAPCEPTAVSWQADGACVTLGDGRRLSARLVVGADGVHSWARREAGIAREPRAYGQTAVVANFVAERAHRGRALQWFIGDDGVLAWLPLPGRRISMVWSAPDALAQQLLALDASALAQRVASGGGHALGTLTLDYATGRVSAVVPETRLASRAPARFGR